MLRRLFALAIVLLLVGAGFYYWKVVPPGSRSLRGLERQFDEARLGTAVRTALALNRRLAECDLSVSAESDRVTLAGSVPSREAHELALRVAGEVPDVGHVIDGIRIVPVAQAPTGDDRTLGERLDDQALEAKLHLAFSLNRSLRATAVQVRVKRRQVTLTGTVEDAAQRERLLQVTTDVPDVSGVTDQLSIRAEAW